MRGLLRRWFHLWHPEQDRIQLPVNQERLHTLFTSSAVRAKVGLDELSRV